MGIQKRRPLERTWRMNKGGEEQKKGKKREGGRRKIQEPRDLRDFAAANFIDQ